MVEPSQSAYHLGLVVTAHAITAVLASAILALVLSQNLSTPPMAPFWAAVVVLTPIMASEPIRRREKPQKFGHANRITLVRAVIVSGFVCLTNSAPGPKIATLAAAVAIIALILDGLDGWVARRTHSTSEYGAQLDMELDSIFMLVLAILVFVWGHAGPWVLFCGLARYGWLVISHLISWFNRPLPPSFRRKTACVVGVGSLALALAPWPWPFLNSGLSVVATSALFISFAIDASWLIQRKSEPLP